MTTKDNQPKKINFDVNVNGTKVSLTCVADLADAPISAGRAFEEDKSFKLFSILLGDAQMQELENAGATIRTFSDVIVPAWQEAAGLKN